MENEKIVVVEERKGLVWKIVAGVVAAAAICAVAAVIIKKITKKKAKAEDEELLDEIDELELLDSLAEDDEAFEAPAEEVIADAE